MAKPIERYFAITIFGYDKDTSFPISLLVPFTVRQGRFVNNGKILKCASEIRPEAILLHVANIQEFKCSDDLLDYIAEPPEASVEFNPEHKGKIMRDGDPEPFFTMTQTMPPNSHLPFYGAFDPQLCQYCQQEETDEDFHPFCSEICEIKAKNS